MNGVWLEKGAARIARWAAAAMLSLSLAGSAHAGDQPAPASVAAAAKPPSEGRAPSSNQVETYRLPNGLTVRFEPDRSRSQVAIALTVRVGSRDDPPGRSGMAHLIEHLLVKKSLNAVHHDFGAEVDAAGGVGFNAHTAPEHSCVFAAFPASNYGAGIWLFSDALAFALTQIDERALEDERGVVLNERWLRRNNPVHVASINVYPEGHRRRVRADADLEAISLSELRGFFQRWYGPHNATLSLVGNFDPREARALVSRYFGPIRNSFFATPGPAPGPSPDARFGKSFELRGMTSEDSVLLAWSAPGLLDTEFPGLSLLVDYFTSTASGLEASLIKAGFARSVSWYLTASDYDGLLVASASLGSRGESREQVQALVSAFDSEFSNLQMKLFDEARLKALKRRRGLEIAGRLSSLTARAIHLAEYGQPLAAELSRYERLTIRDLQQAANYLGPANRLVVNFRRGGGAPSW